ncbi:MAG: anthranilate phosphoribosyltransferase [Actinomycetota bacterium]
MEENIKKFGSLIMRLINKKNLSRSEAYEAFRQVLLNEQTEIQQGAFLAALKAKGETAEEIAGSWEAIYELDTAKVILEINSPLVENCGTGMDDIKTFNISTAASVIAAAAGIIMAKHGARAITSVCGTIDIMEAIGLDVDCDLHVVKKSIEEAGIGIFNGMSPKVHPNALGRILSRISFGTSLNIAASLANPAMPQFGVRGVYARKMVNPVARAMKEIGYKRAIVIHGLDGDGKSGMDEASTLGMTIVSELKENGIIKEYSLSPEEIGIMRTSRESLAPLGDLKSEASRFVGLLSGKVDGACSDIVCLNAAFLLYMMDIAPGIKDGFYQAKEIIKSGKAINKLKSWVKTQQSIAGNGISKLNSLL